MDDSSMVKIEYELEKLCERYYELNKTTEIEKKAFKENQ